MKNYIYNTLLLFSFILFGILQSCKKDSQSFEYQDVNETLIDVDTTEFTVGQFEVLSIQPRLTQTIGNDPHIFEWKVYDSNLEEIISTEEKLSVEIGLAPAKYTLLLTATNTTSGLKSFKKVTLNVVGAFYQGWLVSHNLDNSAQLGFIRTDGEVFIKPASDINNLNMNGKALNSFFYSNFILFFTTNGVYRFNANDFVSMGDTKDILGVSVINFSNPMYGLGAYSIDQFIADSNGLYSAMGPVFFPELLLSPFSDRFAGDYDLFPYFFASGTSTYFYDNKGKRFLTVAYLAKAYNVAPKPSNPAALFDISNIGMTCLSAGRGKSSTLHHYVFANGTERYVYSLNGTTPSINQQILPLNNPEFYKSSIFANSLLYDQIYYAVNNKIYLYSISANTSQLLYEFPSSCIIKTMKWGSTPNDRLVVGVNNGSAGEVYIFEVNDLGKFKTDSYINKYTGFGDITGLNFR